MAQSDSLPDEVAGEIAGLDKRLRDLERTPQLTRSSIDDGRLPSKDAAGRVRSIIGKQPDGSHGSRVVESPAQPRPDAPVLRAGKAGVVAVRWTGGADGPVPLVYGHIEAQVSHDGGDTWEAVSTIRDRDGGATSFVADQAGTALVRLVMVGQDRITRSEPSEVTTIEVELPVDEQEIRGELEAAEQRLSDAVAASDAWSASAMTRTDELAADTSQAQAKADEAVQAAQSAQESYDELSERAQRQIDALIERGDNLVVNGSFEKTDPSSSNDLYGWTRNNTSSGNRSTQDARTGEASVRLAASSVDVPPATIFSTSWPTDAGRTYRTRVWAWKLTHGDDADNNGFQIFVRLHHRDGSTSHLWGEESGRSFGVGGFDERVEDFTLPDDDTILEARFCARALPGSGVYLADDAAGFDITEAAEALAAAQAAEQAAQDAHAAAGSAEDLAASAMDRAGKVGGRLGGETAPTGAAPENTLWFQWSDLEDPDRTVVGLWKMVDGNWTEQDTSDAEAIPHLDIGVGTVGVLTAVRIDVASLYAHDAFVTNLHSEVVNAMKVTGEVGFIGGVLLEDETVTAPKIVASDELTAKIAQFLRVKAVHIDANDIVFNSGIVGELEAHGITLSAEVTNRRFEVSGEGWVLTDTSTGETLASVGVDGTILMKNAQIEGTFRTSYANGSGATISRGDVTYWSVEQGGFTTVTGTPYIRLTPRGGESDRNPTIATDGQRLVLAPGQNRDGAAQPVAVDGRLNAAVVEAADEVGTSQIRLYDGEVGTIGDQAGSIGPSGVSLSLGDETAYLNNRGVLFHDSSLGRRWGIQRSGVNGQNLEISGELRPDHAAQDTIIFGATGWNSTDPGQGIRGSVTYGAPAQAGRRIVQATPKVSSGTWTNFNSTSVAVSSDDASGFAWSARAPSNNSGSFSFRVVYTSFWGSY